MSSRVDYYGTRELIEGIADMRFQSLMPDVLHWLGITKIDNLISMSDMKYNAIVGSGIEVIRVRSTPMHTIFN